MVTLPANISVPKTSSTSNLANTSFTASKTGISFKGTGLSNGSLSRSNSLNFKKVGSQRSNAALFQDLGVKKEDSQEILESLSTLSILYEHLKPEKTAIILMKLAPEKSSETISSLSPSKAKAVFEKLELLYSRQVYALLSEETKLIVGGVDL